MSKNSIITTSAIPNLINKTGVEFLEDEFDILVYQKGLEVIHEKASSCPCRSKENGSPLSNCQNCCGTGWVLFNPNSTKMVLQSLNLSTKYKEWSKENIGTITISSRSVNILGYMDRLTIIDSDSVFSQTLYPSVYKGVLFAFTIYDIKSIEEIFLFQSADEPLIKLSDTYYSFEANKLILDSSYASIENLTISIRYKHYIQYHIIDLVKEMRRSYGLNEKGYDKQLFLPFNAIGRRSHYVLDRANFEGTNVVDNSYLR
jgi:hypothetical protein